MGSIYWGAVTDEIKKLVKQISIEQPSNLHVGVWDRDVQGVKGFGIAGLKDSSMAPKMAGCFPINWITSRNLLV